MNVYNTLSGAVEPLEPTGRAFTLYVCGITPYDTTHLGHAFTYTVADVLVRHLEDVAQWKSAQDRAARSAVSLFARKNVQVVFTSIANSRPRSAKRAAWACHSLRDGGSLITVGIRIAIAAYTIMSGMSGI